MSELKLRPPPAGPVKIDPATAVATREQVGSPLAGWFQFQPMLATILRDEPDLLE